MPAWLDDFLWAYSSFIYGLGVNAILGLSMYVVLALGQLSLGQAAFMGIGAYTSAVLTVRFGVPFPLVLCAAMAAPAFAATLIGVPTLRLTGVYLAMATIGFGEVMRILYINTDYIGGAARLQRHSGESAGLDHLRLARRHPVGFRIGDALQARPRL